MKKSIFLILLLLLVMGGYSSFNGTPWELYSIKKEARLYLQERYVQEMVIIDSEYSLTEASYYVKAYPKGNPDLVFLVNKYKNRDRDGYRLSDNYPHALWRIERDTKLGTFVYQTFSENDSVKVSLEDSGFHQQFDNKSKITNQEILTYRSNRKREGELFRIHVAVQKEFDALNADEDYRNIFDLVNFIKEKHYRIDEIEVCLCEEKGNTKNRKFVIPAEELQAIKTKEDIRSYLI